MAHDGTFQNSIQIGARGNNGGAGGWVYSGNVINAHISPSWSDPVALTRYRQALGWGANQLSQYARSDGLFSKATDAAVALPVGMTTLNFGVYAGGSFQLNGTLESVAYYAGARSDNFVQAVSRG
jgi:hypothetical protein